MNQKKLLVIDGNSLLFRAFYALPLLHTSDGVYTNAVYGFLTMFKKVMDNENPSHIVVAFDKDRQTFRTQLFDAYKANRSAPPEELKGQFQLVREVLTALNVDYLEVPGYEADDIIGTLSQMAQDDEMDCIIVTGDGDALQLVSEKVQVIMIKKGISEIEKYDIAKVKENWEVTPDRMIDIKALMGDSSDNIPGVPGVGAKTAIKLIKEFGSLENLYASLSQVKGQKLVERLAANKDQAYMSRELATIVRDMNLNCRLADFNVKEPHREELMQLYKRLQFGNFLKLLQEQDAHRVYDPVEFQETIEIKRLNSEREVKELIDTIPDGDKVAVYFEVDHRHPMWAQPIGLFWEWQDQVYQLPLQDNPRDRLEWVRPFLASEQIKKIFHNAKFAEVLLMRWGIELKGIYGDTLLAIYVDDPSFDGESPVNSMKRYLGIDPGDRPAAIAANIRRLYNALLERIPQELKDLLAQVEQPLSTILAHMEFWGVKVEKSTLHEISIELASRIRECEKAIFDLAGYEFNINSPKQLGKLLFEDLGLKASKKTKTGYSTGAEVLESLYGKHQIVPYLMDYRLISKLKSTYADSLQALIHPDTGRVHTIFKQAQTATGRLSSVEPNLQNIPIRMEEGRRIRKAFTAPQDGWLLVSADYSQIDLRSLAHISGDEVLIQTFREKVDIHARTASEIFHVPLHQINEDLRRRAKAVNFGIIYGISEYGLARDTGVSRMEAREYIKKYLDTYPGVRQYMEDIVAFGKKYGYVETILKRRRYIPDLNASNKNVQALARRMALNTPIQGTSADIIKLAMIKVFRELKRQGLESRLLLQVHDELVLEVPKKELDGVAQLLEDCMQNAYELKVPLDTTIKIGENWYDLKPYR
jgi:DNA polymerase-1